MDADGSNQTRLTFNLRIEQFPAWSPDSTRIAYVVDFGGHASIFVMNADGSNQLNLTHNVSKDRSQKPARKQGAPNRCCHRTNPTVASSLTTTAWSRAGRYDDRLFLSQDRAIHL